MTEGAAAGVRPRRGGAYGIAPAYGIAAVALFLLFVVATTWRIARNADVPGQPQVQQ